MRRRRSETSTAIDPRQPNTFTAIATQAAHPAWQPLAARWLSRRQPCRPQASGGLVLVLPDGSRVPITAPLTIGRGEEATVRIGDQTVSRLHARIALGPDGPVIEDAGSRFGTLLSGHAADRPDAAARGTRRSGSATS